MKVVIATSNPGKLKEFQELASAEPWLELTMPGPDFAPVETGKTFVENAKIKARAAAAQTKLLAAADDSGLIVEALNGRPGIHSARYCEGTDADRRQKLLAELVQVPDDKRQAAFMCAMAVSEADGTIAFTSIRVWEGYIGRQEKGQNGFGYDSIFYLNNTTTASAELSSAEKNRLSHRGQAFRQVLAFLKERQQAAAATSQPTG